METFIKKALQELLNPDYIFLISKICFMFTDSLTLHIII